MAMSSVFTDAIWMRQPPLGPDKFSIRLAMVGPVSVGVVDGACVTVGWLAGSVGVGAAAGGGVGPVDGVADAVWLGVVPPMSPSTGLVDSGTGCPFAGRCGT